ncbi:hypothetical protein RHS01_08533 [Rhizoctonia solani]|uniref:GEgh 16 protein n=1 Tax=Rhizoctonia solani TaxID=456999 RepID=A0A8H7M1X3_9AGAM|nr:hypothetical protein RHS01_08533 [Rhizoctonia solani]
MQDSDDNPSITLDDQPRNPESGSPSGLGTSAVQHRVTSSQTQPFLQPHAGPLFLLATQLVTGSLLHLISKQHISSNFINTTIVNFHSIMFAKTSAISSVLLVLAAISSVNAHGAMVAVTGSNGVTGQGFGIVETTPRDGTRRQPFQTDTSIIRDREIASGDAGPCGRTLAGGVNDMAAQMEAASSAGLPAASEDGTVTMTIHQINGDGAGPYTCGVSADASGKSFADMKILTNVPGENSRSNAKATDFPLVAQMPAGTTCTGGPNGDACVVRCRNAARAGPFGGCTAVTNAVGGAGNSTAPAAASAPKAAGAKAKEALAEDLYKRALNVVKSFEKKRMLRSRIAGVKAGYWI